MRDEWRLRCRRERLLSAAHPWSELLCEIRVARSESDTWLLAAAAAGFEIVSCTSDLSAVYLLVCFVLGSDNAADF